MQNINRPSLVEAAIPGAGVLREALLILGGSALVALASQIAIPLPFSPVPVTGQTFAVLLIGAALVLAFLTVELKNLMHSVISLGGMCIVLGILFGILNAVYVMVFQLMIYAGATVVLFVSVVMLTERRKG